MPKCEHHKPYKLDYIQLHKKAAELSDKGIEQTQCPECGYWWWPDEMGEVPTPKEDELVERFRTEISEFEYLNGVSERRAIKASEQCASICREEMRKDSESFGEWLQDNYFPCEGKYNKWWSREDMDTNEYDTADLYENQFTKFKEETGR